MNLNVSSGINIINMRSFQPAALFILYKNKKNKITMHFLEFILDRGK